MHLFKSIIIPSTKSVLLVSQIKKRIQTHCRLNLVSYSNPPTTSSVGSVLNFLNRATSFNDTVNSSSAGSCQAAFLRLTVLIVVAPAVRETTAESDPSSSEFDAFESGKAEVKAGGD
jgi:hypothetical protein